MSRRLDSKLECPNCQTIYLTLAGNVDLNTPIRCSSCGHFMGTWGELERDFYEQGGGHGVFSMREGEIIRMDTPANENQVSGGSTDRSD
ncbi:MAG: hypothetical protein AAAB35_15800 [Phyllobacterium sp.]|uniref:hypothetical protein n=1 Tax=Phyllobacterium sp. TaxID=1871046 RepID=UPI0030F18271